MNESPAPALSRDAPAPPVANEFARGSPDRSGLLVVIVCAVGFAFDLSEISFGAALSGVFAAPPYSMRPEHLAWLLASVYIGAILGPPFMGAFADRHGRRIALALTLAFLAVTSFGSAVSSGVFALSVMRGLSGIALGAYPPLMITLLTDVLPAQRRGRLILVTVAIGYLGPPATIFLMRWLTELSPLGLEGWRWVIAIHGVGGLLAGAGFLALPESAEWRAAIATATARELRSWRAVARVSALSFLAPWATVTFPLLSAAFLVARGQTISDTLLFVGISTFGPVVGSVIAASVADRIERRTSLQVCALGMAICAVGFYASAEPAWLMLTSFAFNLCVALYMPALTTYVAEQFPIQLRGRASSLAWSANRIAAATVPLAILPLLHGRGEGPVFGVIVGTLILTSLLLAACGPVRAARGSGLEEGY